MEGRTKAPCVKQEPSIDATFQLPELKAIHFCFHKLPNVGCFVIEAHVDEALPVLSLYY